MRSKAKNKNIFLWYMAYVKKRKYSRRSRKVSKRRRFNISRTKKPRASYILRTIKWSNRDAANLCHNTNSGSDAVSEATGSASFQLTDLQANSEFTAMFDNYRLVKVLYRWVVTRNTDWANTTANRGYPVRILWCHDFNDSTPPSSSELMQRAGMRELYIQGDDMPASRWYTLNPALLSVGYESGVASAYTPKWRQWIDTASSGTPHYGLKWHVSNLFTGINLRLEAKEIYEFKGIS